MVHQYPQKELARKYAFRKLDFLPGGSGGLSKEVDSANNWRSHMAEKGYNYTPYTLTPNPLSPPDPIRLEARGPKE